MEACFRIPVTAWVVNPLILNRIGYGRVSGKYGGAKLLAPDAAEIMYAAALGIEPLVI